MRSLWAHSRTPRRRSGRDGFVLATVIMFMVLIVFLGFGLLKLAEYEAQLGYQTRLARQAFYLAEAGAQRAQARLAVSLVWGSSAFSDSLAGGQYSVTVSVSPSEPGQASILSVGACPLRVGDRETEIARSVEVEVSKGL